MPWQAIWQPKAKGKVSDVSGGGAPHPPPPTRHEGKCNQTARCPGHSALDPRT